MATSYTFTTTDDQDTAIQTLVNNINSALPVDTNGNPIGTITNVSDYVQSKIQSIFDFAVQCNNAGCSLDWLLTRTNEILQGYIYSQLQIQAEAVKQAYLNATPDGRNNITTAVTSVVVNPLPPVITKQ